MHAILAYRGPDARVLHGSLSPEAGREIPRSQVTVDGAGDEVVVRIRAEDAGAMRAALNSYLRWMQVASEAREAASA